MHVATELSPELVEEAMMVRMPLEIQTTADDSDKPTGSYTFIPTEGPFLYGWYRCYAGEVKGKDGKNVIATLMLAYIEIKFLVLRPWWVSDLHLGTSPVNQWMGG